MQDNRLRAKDLITIAIFGVLFFAVYFICAIPTGISIVLYLFCVGISMIPCGVIWSYLRAKVPKRFAVLIQGILMTIIVFIVGSGWFVAFGVLAGTILAEVSAGVGKYKSFKWNVVGYAAFAVCLNLGLFAIILLMRDYYYDFCIASGMDAAYMESLLNFMSGPLLLLTSVLSAVGAIIGMLLGKVLLKKHFVKAGIV
ncbi:MAG: MptD family putative ECF transporter S component [Coriobacteriales bacterium]|nr:MptD family putative ECF transporter S component [Coriobacteriales bacterium]